MRPDVVVSNTGQDVLLLSGDHFYARHMQKFAVSMTSGLRWTFPRFLVPTRLGLYIWRNIPGTLSYRPLEARYPFDRAFLSLGKDFIGREDNI